MTEEQKEQAIELTRLFANAAKNYDTLVVMTVLEAAMTGEIYRQDSMVGQLFEEMMDQFRGEATILLSMSMLMKAVKKAKAENGGVVPMDEFIPLSAPVVCPTCDLTADEYKIATVDCKDSFHTTKSAKA